MHNAIAMRVLHPATLAAAAAASVLLVLVAAYLPSILAAVAAIAVFALLLANHRLAFLAFMFAVPFATLQLIPVPGLSNLTFLMIPVLGLSMLLNLRRIPALPLGKLGAKPTLFAVFILAALPTTILASSQGIALKSLVIAAVILGLYLASTVMFADLRMRELGTTAYLAGVLASAALGYGQMLRELAATIFLRAGVGSPSDSAIWFLLAIPLAVMRFDRCRGFGPKLFYAAVVLASAGIIVLSSTRSAWLGLGLYFVYELVRKPARAIVTAALLMAVVVFFLKTYLPFTYQRSVIRVLAVFKPELEKQTTLQFRIENYPVAAAMVGAYPLLGVGLGNFAAHAPHFGRVLIPGEMGLNAHNAYLEMLTGGGLIGGVAYLLVWLLTLWELVAVALRGPPAARHLARSYGIGFSMFMVHAMFHSSYLVLLLVPVFAMASALRAAASEGEAGLRESQPARA